MAYAIAAEDFLAAMLLLSEGDLDLTTGILLERVNAFQIEHDSTFGVSESDYMMGLFWLGHEFGILTFDDPEKVSSIRLYEWIPMLLDRSSVYFNDEGESWDPHPPTGPSEGIRLLKDFFEGNPQRSSDEILSFLADHGWKREQLTYLLQSGLSNVLPGEHVARMRVTHLDA